MIEHLHKERVYAVDWSNTLQCWRAFYLHPPGTPRISSDGRKANYSFADGNTPEEAITNALAGYTAMKLAHG